MITSAYHEWVYILVNIRILECDAVHMSGLARVIFQTPGLFNGCFDSDICVFNELSTRSQRRSGSGRSNEMAEIRVSKIRNKGLENRCHCLRVTDIQHLSTRIISCDASLEPNPLPSNLPGQNRPPNCCHRLQRLPLVGASIQLGAVRPETTVITRVRNNLNVVQDHG